MSIVDHWALVAQGGRLSRNLVCLLCTSLLLFVQPALADSPRNTALFGGATHWAGIWGTDNRFLTEWSQPSLRPIVRLIRADGGLLCTGTVVAEDTVLTAAHCIHETFRNGAFLTSIGVELPQVEIFDGRKFRVDDARVPAEEFEGPRPFRHDHIALTDVTPDVAFLLVRGIARYTGKAHVSPHINDDDAITLIAFHEDQPSRLMAGSCRADLYRSVWVYDRINHRCTVWRGASGGPLVRAEARDNDQIIVVGVQSAASDNYAHASYLGGEAAIWSFLRRGISGCLWCPPLRGAVGLGS